jgi:hypothetical protein
MTTATPRARRLWELEPAAHDLLLAGSFTPDELRALVARALGRLHRARCVLAGSDADVLYSAVHDLGTRNALSETLHDALARRHATAALRWRALKDPLALQRAWRERMVAGSLAPPVADLWSLLTHPASAGLEQAALHDYRQRVLAVARDAAAADTRAQQAAAALAELRGRCNAHRQRVLVLQQSMEALQRQLAAAEAAARGASQRTDLAEARWADSLRQRPVPAAVPADVPTVQGVRSPTRWAPAARHAAVLHEPAIAAPAIEVPPSRPSQPRPEMAGRRLLCVGGMPGARQRYRALVEAAGARFDYHDGGIEDNVARLDNQLAAADLVVCHSACLNHEAYHRIKGHCQRHDKPCVYLARPSLSFFARELGLGRAERAS